MNRKRIKAAVVLLLFLVAGVLYSTDRNQDFFVEEGTQEVEEVGQTQETEGAVAEENRLLETSTQEASDLLRVHVCGAVKEAGVYRLAEHSIVADAVALAGGFDKGSARDYLNLAAEVADGDKIYVPYKKEVEEEKVGGILSADGSKTNESGLVNINTADEALLTTLSGIGSARAQAIINWRNEHGAFASIEDIMQVSGIKEAAYAKIKDFICV